MIVANVYRFIVLAFLFIGISACHQEPNHMITQKWKMVDNELTLEIRADSSYVVIENNGKPQVGKWRISDDSKTITFKEKNDPVVNMDIITLSDERLILNRDNGEEMVFERSSNN